MCLSGGFWEQGCTLSCIFVCFIVAFSFTRRCQLSLLCCSWTVTYFVSKSALGIRTRTDTKTFAFLKLIFSKCVVYLQNSLARCLGNVSCVLLGFWVWVFVNKIEGNGGLFLKLYIIFLYKISIDNRKRIKKQNFNRADRWINGHYIGNPLPNLSQGQKFPQNLLLYESPHIASLCLGTRVTDNTLMTYNKLEWNNGEV